MNIFDKLKRDDKSVTGGALLIEPHYFPCIEFLAALKQYKILILDTESAFIKSTYLNRTYISSVNKTMMLSIPLERGRHNHNCIKDVKISYHEDWIKQHIKTFNSAYGGSSFYTYYKDVFEAILVKRYTFLSDLVIDTTIEMVRVLNPEVIIKPISSVNSEMILCDMRNTILPINRVSYLHPAYYQVFDYKHGFINNLSGLDVLYNLGPEVEAYINSL